MPRGRPRKPVSDRPKREPNRWIKALQSYNAGKGDWCIPRKGSEDYNKIMNTMNTPAATKKPKGKRVLRKYIDGKAVRPTTPTYTRQSGI